MEAPAISRLGLDGARRPLWSVMIPAFNPRPDHFQQALQSVLAQDPGPGQMQIEVVDDCSPDVDVATLVRSTAGDRIAFYRNRENLGLARGWNRCIERSNGVWVHILHQDDYVLPGFYDRLTRVAAAHPEASLIAARCSLVDEQGTSRGDTIRLEKLESGSHDVGDYLYENPFRCPGMVVRREFYESSGGFQTDLTFTLDWELWIRAIALGGGVAVPEVLAAYRSSAGNQSARLAQNADTLNDRMRLNALFAQRYPEFDRKKANRFVCLEAFTEARRFAKLGNKRAASASFKYFLLHAPIRLKVTHLAGWAFRRIARAF